MSRAASKYLAIVLIMLVGMVWAGCKEPFDPSIDSLGLNYLVIEGFINGSGESRFNLTRSQRFSGKAAVKGELKANLTIESDDNIKYPVNEVGNGIYTTLPLSLPAGKTYRLRIKTAGSGEYLSDFSELKKAPPIKVSWERISTGMNIYANSTDPANNTIYYKYDYEEILEMRSPFSSNTLITRRKPIAIGSRGDWGMLYAYLCWKSGYPNEIITTSTPAQSDDVVEKFRVTSIAEVSDKLAVRYSIILRQYALNKQAYEFYELMKRNTKQLGPVLYPQPITVRGNVRSVSNPDEFVVVYVIASAASEERIFITREEAKWKYEMLCNGRFVAAHPDSLSAYLGNSDLQIGGSIINEKEYPPILTGYNAVPPACVDCRERGGHNIRPSFW